MRRCVFLDRDGVINAKVPDGEYVRTWSEFRFLPGIVDWIRLFKASGHLVIVVTNQRGVARGLVGADDLEVIHQNMLAELARAGAQIDDVFVCPHEADCCDCRKPRPGLVHAAREKWNIDLANSLMIGDSESDRQLAAACEMTFVLARNGRVEAVETLEARQGVISAGVSVGQGGRAAERAV